MAYQTIRYEVIDSVAILTLNRPEVANGFNIPMCEEILEAIRLAEGMPPSKFYKFKHRAPFSPWVEI